MAGNLPANRAVTGMQWLPMFERSSSHQSAFR
ncbi:MAG: hypothetical protein ETSY2_53330 [Candidatus Entotheonella gemina]|uniref:Uncharacterized protein n=1 Tax=Candidatus Entotheonella gemina TaxID=1429439 RepID=W4L305_9BACT|nr:MAG: hypothetical protein ETSY2_53330 [Candidatus Entotheonella gemina]